MKLNSLTEAREQMESVQSEMESLAQNMIKNVDRDTSLARMNELSDISEKLSVKLQDAEQDAYISLVDDTGLSKDALEIESTLGNAIGVIDAVLARVIALYRTSSDEEKTEIAKQISDVETISEIANIKPTSGRGVRLTDARIVQIREDFKVAWETNPYIKLPKFMDMMHLNMQAYSLGNLIRGKTYADIGGPIRGVDYDTEPRRHRFAGAVQETA